jgi:hypothetical protein
MKIYASTGDITLLKDGNVPQIGFTTEKKKWLLDETCLILTEVCFYFDTNHRDNFYFEDGQLVYHSVSLDRYPFVVDLYRELIKKTLSPAEFINEVTATYTVKEIGL